MPPKKKSLLVFKNPEKAGHTPSSDPFIPAVPFRMVLAGPPGAGKRSQMLNIIANLERKPVKIIVIHGDPDTVEYRGITDDVRGPDEVPTLAEMTGEPGPDAKATDKTSFDRDDHKLVIIDEIPWHSLKKDVMSTFERLLNHISTHATTSVMLAFQQLVAVPPSVRRAMDHVLLFKNADMPAASGLAERVGMSYEALAEIMGAGKRGRRGKAGETVADRQGIVRDKHDSLWIDLTANPEDEHRLRLNLWTPIHRRQDTDD